MPIRKFIQDANPPVNVSGKKNCQLVRTPRKFWMETHLSWKCPQPGQKDRSAKVWRSISVHHR